MYAAIFGLTAEELNILTEILMVLVVLIWKLVWYAIALFRTIERRQIRWFIVLFIGVLLLPFDLGLLAIIYLLLYKNPDRQIKKPNRQVKKRKKR